MGFTGFWQSDHVPTVPRNIFISGTLGARALPFPVYMAKVEMRAAKMGINVGLFLCFSIAIDLDPDTHTYTHTLHSTK